MYFRKMVSLYFQHISMVALFLTHFLFFLVNNRISPVLPLSEAERRIRRLNDLPKLIQAERVVILQASAALQQCVSIPFRKSPEDFDRIRELGPGSRVHVEASRTMLIACKIFITAFYILYVS